MGRLEKAKRYWTHRQRDTDIVSDSKGRLSSSVLHCFDWEAVVGVEKLTRKACLREGAKDEHEEGARTRDSGGCAAQ